MPDIPGHLEPLHATKDCTPGQIRLSRGCAPGFRVSGSGAHRAAGDWAESRRGAETGALADRSTGRFQSALADFSQHRQISVSTGRLESALADFSRLERSAWTDDSGIPGFVRCVNASASPVGRRPTGRAKEADSADPCTSQHWQISAEWNEQRGLTNGASLGSSVAPTQTQTRARLAEGQPGELEG
jgi:hypothetical protein